MASSLQPQARIMARPAPASGADGVASSERCGSSAGGLRTEYDAAEGVQHWTSTAGFPCDGPVARWRSSAGRGARPSALARPRRSSGGATPERWRSSPGTPVNSLVVTWAEGSEGDERHQRALAPLIAAARKRGLWRRRRGWGPVADLKRAAGSAQAAGLDAIATESSEPVPGGVVLRFRERSLIDRSHSDFLGVVSTVWPGASPSLPTGADAASGPTGPPWLDSNAWYVRLARALVDPKVFWLAFDPPDLGQPVARSRRTSRRSPTPRSAGRAGWSRWTPTCASTSWNEAPRPSKPGPGSAAASPSSRRTAPGRGYLPVGQLGVVSAYGGPDEFLSFEVLNLLARQSCLYRILEKSRALETPFAGLDAVLYVDGAPPAGDLAGALRVRRGGGTLITPPGWEVRGVPDGDCVAFPIPRPPDTAAAGSRWLAKSSRTPTSWPRTRSS